MLNAVACAGGDQSTILWPPFFNAATVSFIARVTGGCGRTQPSSNITPNVSPGPPTATRRSTSATLSGRQASSTTSGSCCHGLAARMVLTKISRSEIAWPMGPITECTRLEPSICIILAWTTCTVLQVCLLTYAVCHVHVGKPAVGWSKAIETLHATRQSN